MGRSTIYVEPTFWSKESQKSAFNNFAIAFEGEKGTETTGVWMGKGKTVGYGTTSPCMINEVWSKCGAKWGAVEAAYMKKLDAMMKIAATLPKSEQKAFWKKMKADPVVVAEYKEAEAKK